MPPLCPKHRFIFVPLTYLDRNENIGPVKLLSTGLCERHFRLTISIVDNASTSRRIIIFQFGRIHEPVVPGFSHAFRMLCRTGLLTVVIVVLAGHRSRCHFRRSGGQHAADSSVCLCAARPACGRGLPRSPVRGVLRDRPPTRPVVDVCMDNLRLAT
jgi:hypothetical protein